MSDWNEHEEIQIFWIVAATRYWRSQPLAGAATVCISRTEVLCTTVSRRHRKAHGAQRSRHINSIGEKASTVQRRDAPEKWIYKGALMLLMIDNYDSFIAKADSVIASGEARTKLEQLIALSNRFKA